MCGNIVYKYFLHIGVLRQYTAFVLWQTYVKQHKQIQYERAHTLYRSSVRPM